MSKSPYSAVNMDAMLAINTFSLAVQDYQVMSPTLARVVLSYSGTPPSKDEVRTSIAKMFNGMASAVTSSFTALDPTGAVKAVVGFVKANRQVRELSDMDPARTKVMSSNLLMDTEDKSLWEIKAGASGQYVVKQGQEDLSELVHLAHTRRSGIPSLTEIASVTGDKDEFVAYVDKTTEEVHTGFVIASTDDKMTVVAFESNEEVEIESAQLVQARYLDADDRKNLSKSPMAAEVANDRKAMVEYYKQAYSYSPEYIQAIIDMIDQHSFA